MDVVVSATDLQQQQHLPFDPVPMEGSYSGCGSDSANITAVSQHVVAQSVEIFTLALACGLLVEFPHFCTVAAKLCRHQPFQASTVAKSSWRG
jgi:hypothetical protein